MTKTPWIFWFLFLFSFSLSLSPFLLVQFIYLVNALVFINAVIRATDDLDFRMQLRNEFFAVDFGHIFEVLLDFGPLLTAHIKLYLSFNSLRN